MAGVDLSESSSEGFRGFRAGKFARGPLVELELSKNLARIGVHNSTFRPISVDFQNFQRKLSAYYQSARRGVYHSSCFDRY